MKAFGASKFSGGIFFRHICASAALAVLLSACLAIDPSLVVTKAFAGSSTGTESAASTAQAGSAAQAPQASSEAQPPDISSEALAAGPEGGANNAAAAASANAAPPASLKLAHPLQLNRVATPTNEDTGDFSVSGGAYGHDYSFDVARRVLAILTSTPLTIANADPHTPTTDHIVVQSGITANITLAGVDIENNDGDGAAHGGTTALNATGATLQLTLQKDSTNILKSGSGAAALLVPSGAALAVDGKGTLNAIGGSYSSGIGGGWYDAGSITINDGVITATGGTTRQHTGGAGIGGGAEGSGSNVTINGGRIDATGGGNAAGIGGGYYGSGGTVAITGGSVTATGDGDGAGIGRGKRGDTSTFSTRDPLMHNLGNAFIVASSISDTSGAEPAAADPWSGVIIQGSTGQVYGDTTLTTDAFLNEGVILVVPKEYTLTVGTGVALDGAGTIENRGYLQERGSIGKSLNLVNFREDIVLNGITGKDFTFDGHVLTIISATPLTIANADPHTPTADHIAVQSGITANVTLAGVNIDAGARGACAFDVTGATLDLTLRDGTANTLKSGVGMAGLQIPSGASVVIDGKGALQAIGGSNASGIGGGSDTDGGGVAITGGSIAAAGAGSASGIGGGSGGGSGTFSTTNPITHEVGNAFIVASSIGDTSGAEPGAADPWSGAIIQGKIGQVYGTPTLAGPATVDAGFTLAIPEANSLSIAEGIALTNNGTLDIDGALINNGTLVNNNALNGTGAIDSYVRQGYASITSAGAISKALMLKAHFSDLVITGGIENEDFSCGDDGILAIKSAAPLTIANEDPRIAIGMRVEVESSEANITLAGVNLLRKNPNDYVFSAAGADRLNLTLQEGTANSLTSGRKHAGLQIGSHTTLVIDGTGSLEAHGGNLAAGIGGGYRGDNGTVIVNSGTVVATGLKNGAGIGGGQRSTYYGQSVGGGGGTITINGGRVTATGGEGASGIGGGGLDPNHGDTNYAGGAITITGGSVAANGGSAVAGIGGGDSGGSGTFSTTDSSGNPGNAFIVASRIADTSGFWSGARDPWSGVIFSGTYNGGPSGRVYGHPVLGTDATMIDGSTLTIDGDHTLTIGSGITLTNNGTINNYGGIIKQGVLVNNGIINASSKVRVVFSSPAAIYDEAAFAITAAVSASSGIDALRGAGVGTVDFWLGEVDSGTLLGTSEAQVNSDGSISAALTVTKDVWDKGDTGQTKWAMDADNTIAVDFGGSGQSSASDRLLASQGAGQMKVNRIPVTDDMLAMHVSDRDYDGQPIAATLVNAALEQGDATYFYRDATGGDDFAEGLPANAGTYQIKAKIAQTDHYASAETPIITTIIAKQQPDLSVFLNGWGYGAEPHAPVVSGDPEGASISYEYKRAGDPDSAYFDTRPTDAGAYTLKATVAETQNYLAASATCDFAIAPAPQVAPGSLAGQAETISHEADGTIGGLTTAMEYAVSETGPYAVVADAQMSFAAGVYYVRFAANQNHTASTPTLVTIASGRKLEVRVPTEQTGYSLTADKSELDWHEGVKLPFRLHDGWSKGAGFSVKVNGAAVALGEDGALSVHAAESDILITVEGVVPVSFRQQTIYDVSHNGSLTGMIAENARLTLHPLSSGDTAYDSLARMAVGAGEDILAGYEVTLEGTYKGKLVASFKVGDAYNARGLSIYHQTDNGTVETFGAQVKDGWVSAEVGGLSPFLVAAPQKDGGGQGGAGGVRPQADRGGKDGSDDPKPLPSLAPKTGDKAPWAPCALAALLSGLALVALEARKRRAARIA